MAHEILKREYADRLANPEIYWNLTYGVRFMGYAKSYNLEVPATVGKGLLMFGNFEESDEMSCLPWVVGLDITVPRDFNNSGHRFAISEVREGVHGFRASDYNYRTTDNRARSAADVMYPGYVWPTAESEPGSYNFLVPKHFTERDTELQPKISIIARETEAGRALEDHTVCIDGLKIAGGRVEALLPA